LFLFGFLLVIIILPSTSHTHETEKKRGTVKKEPPFINNQFREREFFNERNKKRSQRK